MELGPRIEERLSALKISQSELGRRAGVPQTTLNSIIREGRRSSPHLVRLARELKTTPAYLTGETDDPSLGYVPAPAIDEVAESLGLVPVREIDLSFGMGATYLDLPVTEEVRHFDRGWLRGYTRSDPDKLFFAQGAGDSMEPTIRDSDLLLIDTAQRVVSMSDKVWAIAYASCGAIRRLRPRADGAVEMLCDNPLVPGAIAWDGEMEALGRVVAVVRKM